MRDYNLVEQKGRCVGSTAVDLHKLFKTSLRCPRAWKLPENVVFIELSLGGSSVQNAKQIILLLLTDLNVSGVQ